MHEEAEAILNHPDANILSGRYELNTDFEALELEWDWFTVFDEEAGKPLPKSRNFEEEPAYYIVLLSQNSSRQGVQESPLNDLSTVLYYCMTSTLTGHEIIAAVLAYFEVPDDAEAAELKDMIADQIKEFIGSGVLKVSESQQA